MHSGRSLHVNVRVGLLTRFSDFFFFIKRLRLTTYLLHGMDSNVLRTTVFLAGESIYVKLTRFVNIGEHRVLIPSF